MVRILVETNKFFFYRTGWKLWYECCLRPISFVPHVVWTIQKFNACRYGIPLHGRYVSADRNNHHPRQRRRFPEDVRSWRWHSKVPNGPAFQIHVLDGPATVEIRFAYRTVSWLRIRSSTFPIVRKVFPRRPDIVVMWRFRYGFCNSHEGTENWIRSGLIFLIRFSYRRYRTKRVSCFRFSIKTHRSFTEPYYRLAIGPITPIPARAWQTLRNETRSRLRRKNQRKSMSPTDRSECFYFKLYLFNTV